MIFSRRSKTRNKSRDNHDAHKYLEVDRDKIDGKVKISQYYNATQGYSFTLTDEETDRLITLLLQIRRNE